MPSINDRALIAGDPRAGETDLLAASIDRSPKVRAAAAENPSTPPEVLAQLVEDDRWQVRFAVVDNPTAEALRIALSSSDPDVRGLAAQRDDLNRAQVQQVLQDPAHSVREQLSLVATDDEVMRRLARDPHPAVRASLASNSALPLDVLVTLARDGRAAVRSAAAASRRLPPEVLTELATDRSVQVQWNVLVSNPERLDIATTIAGHSDAMNVDQAQAQLEHPENFTRFLGPIDLVQSNDNELRSEATE
ncbi:hypothetical protein [Janibacter terrae]|uniref:hypothetical protein n=1 Tax=Janibacter terrae TaxID=103817 RepID=UPI0014699F5D|nr:hypothetical protein [Janibacter terrae]